MIIFARNSCFRKASLYLQLHIAFRNGGKKVGFDRKARTQEKIPSELILPASKNEEN